MATRSTLKQKNKDDLIDIILALKEELKKNVEMVEQRKSQKETLGSTGVGLVRKDREYSLVVLKYDEESMQGAVEKMVKLGPDYAIALYKAKKFLVEDILQKL